MVHSFILASGDLGQIAEAFGLKPWLFLSQCFSFAVVCFLLNLFAYQPILKVLEERRQKIEQGLADAKRIKEQLAESEARHREILAQANAEAQKMIDEARASVQALREKGNQQAASEAEQIVTKAHAATVQERERMLVELKREVTRLVVDTTAKVTGKVLNPDDHRRLSEEASREIAA
jgi:F-type H+-transporting ATPase subunit b